VALRRRSMQYLEYSVPRIRLPRTPVNKPRILPLRAASDTASGYDGFIARLDRRERTRAMSTDGRVGFVVGDATGKGVPAAIVTTATAAYLGAVAAASDSSPGEALALANEALFARIPPNMFVTCFYAILDPRALPLPTPMPDTSCPTYTVTATPRS
jgi:hypothetical protein